jgi:uncharacterized protein YbjT (DUF2867 family)
MAAHLKNIALVGATGNLGTHVLQAMLEGGQHSITVITRSASSATFPPSVALKKGDYHDDSFLADALQGQDVLIIMLAFAGLPDQHLLFEAAAKAGVKFVIPSDYGASSADEKLAAAIPVIALKRADHKKIEDLGMKWISVVTSGWIDYSLIYGAYDIRMLPVRCSLILLWS